MHSGRYVKWKPFTGILYRLHFDALVHDLEGFRILLRGPEIDDDPLRFSFPNPLLVRVVTDEYGLTLPGKKSGLDPYHPFYVVEDSPLTAAFAQSARSAGELTVKHYALYFQHLTFIDVLTAHEPGVEALVRGVGPEPR
jgi:hypothetical protein